MNKNNPLLKVTATKKSMKIGQVYSLADFKEYIKVLEAEGEEYVYTFDSENMKSGRVRRTDLVRLVRDWGSPKEFALKKMSKGGINVTTARYDFK